MSCLSNTEQLLEHIENTDGQCRSGLEGFFFLCGMKSLVTKISLN